MKQKLQQLTEYIRSFEDCKEYTSWNGKKCLSICGSVRFFLLLCDEFALDFRWASDLLMEADEKEFSLEYSEGEIILAVSN